MFEHYVTGRGVQGFEKKGKPEYTVSDWMALPRDNRGMFGVVEEVFFPPDSGLAAFKRGVHRTILQRGFTIETAKTWELSVDAVNNRAIFVVRDRRGRLRGVSGRAIHEWQKPKYLHYSWDRKNECFSAKVDYSREDDFERFKKSLVLYGEHMVRWEGVPESRRYLVLCEGPTDVLWCWQCGFQAVAVQGSSLSKEQIETLLALVPREIKGIIVAADADDAGEKLRREAHAALARRLSVFDARFEPGTDPAATPEDRLDQIFLSAKPVVSID